MTRRDRRSARNIPDQCFDKLAELQADGIAVRWIAFPPEGGNRWSVVTDRGFFNRNIPQECSERMQAMHSADAQIRCVAFPPEGGNRWSVISDQGFYNRNIPDECHLRHASNPMGARS